MTDLLPCPFCGEVPTSFDTDQGTKWGHVYCGGGAYGPEVRTGYEPAERWKENAIAAWNTRVHDPALIDGLDDLLGDYEQALRDKVAALAAAQAEIEQLNALLKERWDHLKPG